MPALVANPLHDRRGCALADLSSIEVDPAHPGLRGEDHEARGPQLTGRTLPQAVCRLGQNHHGPPLRSLVREAGKLRGVRELVAVDASYRDELGGLPVAERDGAGLVQQERVDVAGRLDGPAGHGQHVVLDEPVHAGDTDRRQQRPDGRGDQADQQGDQHDQGL